MNEGTLKLCILTYNYISLSIANHFFFNICAPCGLQNISLHSGHAVSVSITMLFYFDWYWFRWRSLPAFGLGNAALDENASCNKEVFIITYTHRTHSSSLKLLSRTLIPNHSRYIQSKGISRYNTDISDCKDAQLIHKRSPTENMGAMAWQYNYIDIRNFDNDGIDDYENDGDGYDDEL